MEIVFVERQSTAQSSSRRDLKLVLEAVGVKGVKLVLSDDSKFIDTVILSYNVCNVFKKCARDILGIYPFPLHVVKVERRRQVQYLMKTMSDFSACYLINCTQFHIMYTVIAVENVYYHQDTS